MEGCAFKASTPMEDGSEEENLILSEIPPKEISESNG
jgi:hypothetical protein